MIGRISRFMTRFVSRWLPDPLIFAMLLTLLNVRDRALVNTTNADQHGENVG